MSKNLYIISGCNGAGKTTASYTMLPEILDCREFVNADEGSAYDAESGTITLTAGGNEGYAIYDVKTNGAYTFEADVKVLSGAFVGLSFGAPGKTAEDFRTCLRFVLETGRVFAGNSWVFTVGENTYAIGDTVNLKIVVTETTYTAYVNGVEKTSGPIPEGSSTKGYIGLTAGWAFAEFSNIKLTAEPEPEQLNGFVVGEDGELRYYDNDEAQYAGVMAYDGGYVYFNSTCTAVKNKTNYYVTKTNDLVEIGYYDFDANGVMTASVGEAIGDNLYADPDGEIRFYDGAEAAYQGVVTDNDGNFYYVNSMKKAVKDQAGYVITKTNGLLPAGAYNIGADGKIAVNCIDAAGKLIKQADGEVIYFENGEAQYQGVVQATDGSYYYVNSTKKAVRSQTYFITKTNGLIEAGLYDIGADGVIAIS